MAHSPSENTRPAGDGVCACRWQGPDQHWSILSPSDWSQLINQRLGSVTSSNVTSSIIKTFIKPAVTHCHSAPLLSARQSLSSLHPPPALLLTASPNIWERALKCLATPTSLQGLCLWSTTVVKSFLWIGFWWRVKGGLFLTLFWLLSPHSGLILILSIPLQLLPPLALLRIFHYSNPACFGNPD